MPGANRPLRLILLAVLALLAAALLWVMFGVLRGAIELWQQWRELPGWAQVIVAIVVAAAVSGIAWAAVWLLRPRRRVPRTVAPPTRAEVEQRIGALAQRRADTAALQAELHELDRRAHAAELYVAVFGEISAGKSSVIRALAPEASAQVDVLGGTTRAVTHYRAPLAGGIALTLADVPGTHEVARRDAIDNRSRAQRDDHSPLQSDGDVTRSVTITPPLPRQRERARGEGAPAGGGGLGVGAAQREQLARDEALRAHVVLYICAGDLTRDQDAELRWLHDFGKPLVLALNKADQFDASERSALERALRDRYAGTTDACIVISAGGSERFERRLADGRVEQVQRERKAEIAPLFTLLQRYAAAGAAAFEPAREAAVLTAVAGRADALQAQAREAEAQTIVAKYTRRAVVGAMAAVLPGTDLVVQGVLATALIRELSKLYEVPVRDLDVDAFLGQVKLTVRTSTSIVLAIAGNAAKAFPGLGTLGGGVLHAIAYGLIFDSLGEAVASTLRDQNRLDAATAGNALARLLSDASAERLRRIARYVVGPPDGGES